MSIRSHPFFHDISMTKPIPSAVKLLAALHGWSFVYLRAVCSVLSMNTPTITSDRIIHAAIHITALDYPSCRNRHGRTLRAILPAQARSRPQELCCALLSCTIEIPLAYPRVPSEVNDRDQYPELKYGMLPCKSSTPLDSLTLSFVSSVFQ